MSADNLLDGVALIPLSTNEELSNIFSGSFVYIMTIFYSQISTTNRRLQIAWTYNDSDPKMAIRMYSSNGWINWKLLGSDTDIQNIINGTIVVPKATNANYATSAGSANSCTNANYATTAGTAESCSGLDSYISQNPKYYNVSSALNIDNLLDPVALCALSNTLNTELYNLFDTAFAWIITIFASNSESNKIQIAFSYTAKTKMAIRFYTKNTAIWSEWNMNRFYDDQFRILASVNYQSCQYTVTSTQYLSNHCTEENTILNSSDELFLSAKTSGVIINKSGYYNIHLQYHFVGGDNDNSIRIGFRKFISSSNYTDYMITKKITGFQTETWQIPLEYFDAGTYIRPLIGIDENSTTSSVTLGNAMLKVYK